MVTELPCGEGGIGIGRRGRLGREGATEAQAARVVLASTVVQVARG
jgi:hypothetical protein